ncbi:MAG TPA: transglycosylase [Asticcacaulis sp.]|nr:transglycosylase [Asticcacaulis sp.]
MTLENYTLATFAGFVIGWIANMMSKSRFSFPINLFVAIFGAILLNFFLRTAEYIDNRFFAVLGVSLLGSAGLLAIFHLSRQFERR